MFSVISVSGNGDVLRHADYTRKDEMEDERVDLLLDRIKKNFDWSNTEWPVIEAEETEMEEADTESEADKSVDATDIAADVETSSVHVAGRGKRKIQDEGAETRKKKLLCKRTAEKNRVLMKKLRVSLRVWSTHLSIPWEKYSESRWRVWRACSKRGSATWRSRFHNSKKQGV